MGPINAALDLAIDLPERGSRHVGRDLHRQLRSAIVGGRLRSGLRLPSTRDLAAALGVSRNTVVTAYDLLLSEGYVSAHGRAGTLVADFLGAARSERMRAGSGRDTRLTQAWRAPSSLIATGVRDDCRFDFSVGVPEWHAFPHSLWRRLSARSLRRAAKARSGYGEPQGSLALREAIAGHISFARAIASHADDIVVTAGAQQAFDLLARILVTPGKTRVAVEDPGYPPLANVLRAAGAKVSPVAVDNEGLKVDRLPRDAKVICVTPSHQFPLGVHLSLARRRALLDFARTHGAVVIEDDYDGEFRHGGKPLDALQTLDRSQTVFYVGTFSKSLFPALRLGFVIAPPWARHALVAVKQACDWHAPALPQDILAAFIAEGHLARHVRKMRRLYGERREILHDALKRYCGNKLRVVGIGAGLHLAAFLSGAVSGRALIEKAREAGIWLDDVKRSAATEGKSAVVVFGYGAIDSRQIEEAIRRLARLIK
jgi:GntR family transcriptional regulator / MocR family aminotransferase